MTATASVIGAVEPATAMVVMARVKPRWAIELLTVACVTDLVIATGVTVAKNVNSAEARVAYDCIKAM